MKDFIEIINFTDACKDDLLWVLSLRNRDDIRIQMDNSNIISEQEHLNFALNLKHKRKHELWYLFKINHKNLGVYCFKDINWEKRDFCAGCFFDTNQHLKWNQIYMCLCILFEILKLDKPYSYIKKTNMKAVLLSIIKGEAIIQKETDDYIYLSYPGTSIIHEKNWEKTKQKFSLEADIVIIDSNLKNKNNSYIRR